ncbi:hypothetical protein D3C76_837520 [compost metagenome]
MRCLSASTAWVNGLLELDAWAQPSIASRICWRSSRMRASRPLSSAGTSTVTPAVSARSFSNNRCKWVSLIALPSSEMTVGLGSASASLSRNDGNDLRVLLRMDRWAIRLKASLPIPMGHCASCMLSRPRKSRVSSWKLGLLFWARWLPLRSRYLNWRSSANRLRSFSENAMFWLVSTSLFSAGKSCVMEGTLSMKKEGVDLAL